ncbi:hypothetical protein OG884_15615 [Streptosporangium sp. NBC_01755]|uniref:hypothetical protein n=1 Tax=Streptosporangium sp. NBC_01755 TaxID=2975949 RepID=UPI002DD8751D|nr:hypothetical protein [Streptosporangium sp. NBC_01755]WSD03262.1 hypothetical protein OG884_15615 [Streptosporangium sp. NBC_01755]
MTRLRPEHRQPGESQRDFNRRTAPWDVMIRLATEVKTVRSRMLTAVETLLDATQRGKIPASQTDQVAEWGGVMVEMLARLDRMDLDAWKPGIRAEIGRSAGTDPEGEDAHHEASAGEGAGRG